MAAPKRSYAQSLNMPKSEREALVRKRLCVVCETSLRKTTALGWGGVHRKCLGAKDVFPKPSEEALT